MASWIIRSYDRYLKYFYQAMKEQMMKQTILHADEAGGMHFRPVTDQPLFYLALLSVILGVMLFLAGFICEMVSRNSTERNKYNIKEEF